MEEINKATDIIDILFNYCIEHFDDFGHKDWEGKSWSPFVETCFILEGKKYGGRYKIRHCSTHPNLTKYLEQFHRYNFPEKLSQYFKHPCRGNDVSWIEHDNSIFLALEHSEDSQSESDHKGQTEIKRIQRELNYLKDEDKYVKGVTAINQLLAIRDEINKLKDYKAHFKVLISRPNRFKKFYGLSSPSYSKSVEYFKNKIEYDLQKDAGLFNIDETWVIILIAPNPDKPKSKTLKPDKIIFHCYEWNGKNEVGKLSAIDEKHEKYTIPIKIVNGKWVKIPHVFLP